MIDDLQNSAEPDSPPTDDLQNTIVSDPHTAGWNHVLKIKDDRVPRLLTFDNDEFSEGEKKIKPLTLRKEIEPWLTALFQSEHLSLLVGSGLTQAVHYIATNGSGVDMKTAKFSQFEEEINLQAHKSAQLAQRGQYNIEDQIRSANELLKGLKIFASNEATFRGSGKLKKKIAKLEQETKNVLMNFASDILRSERNILESKKQEAFNILVSFLMSFASRTASRQRLHIFTTNYDRLIEFGSELAGIRLLDRFVGNISPIFRSSRLEIDLHYNPPGIRGEPRYLEGVVHYTKLHGSLDWQYIDGYVRRTGLPFGSSSIDTNSFPQNDDPGNKTTRIIYPNSAKDRETAEYPYVDLFRDFAAAICRPNSTLVIYGYSFGDEHINRVIEDMLTIPSTHIVIIAYDDKENRINNFFTKTGRSSQFTLLVGNHLADITNLVNLYLPKPAIDKNTKKMVELLRARGIQFTEEKNVTNEGESYEPISD